MAGTGNFVMSAHTIPSRTILLSRSLRAQDLAYFSDLCHVGYLTRFLGYLLFLTMSGLQLPHIFKLLKSRSSQGISVLNVAFKLHAVSSNVTYCIYHNFPLSTWGESMPLMAQYVTVTCLLLLYSGRERHMLVFVLTYVTCMVLLLMGAVPSHVIDLLKVLTIPLTSVGKVLQIYRNYRVGGQSQLSLTSTLFLNVHTLGRLVTSAADTRDGLMMVCHAHSCLWNSIMTCQTLYYLHRHRKQCCHEERATTDKKVLVLDCAVEESEAVHRLRRRRYSFVASRCG